LDVIGTKRSILDVRYSVAIEGKADVHLEFADRLEGALKQLSAVRGLARRDHESSGDGNRRYRRLFRWATGGRGNDVTFVARGEQLRAILRDGLQVLSPNGNVT